MRFALRLTLAAALVAATASGAAAEPLYASEARVAHLAGALEALAVVGEASLADTQNYIYLVERNQCQAPLESMTIACLLEAARRQCEQRPAARRELCHRVSDILITNRSSERVFVSRSKRYEIMSRHSDYRTELFRYLRRRYATLAVELSLRAPDAVSVKQPAVLAAAIDRYCLEVAATQDLAWQHCAAALVWFIGTSGGPLQEGP